MNEHDARILGPKNKPVRNPEVLAEFHRTHDFCQVCGRDLPEGTAHHILGGRCGRSDEPVNLLYCCWVPCHSIFADMTINLPVILAMKIRAGELERPIMLNKPGSIEIVTSPGWDRLVALHGRGLPTPAPIPEHFAALWRRNRPELQ